MYRRKIERGKGRPNFPLRLKSGFSPLGHLYGTVPAENMSDKQRRAIGLIENSLQIHFNGRTLGDVSTFIGLFKPQSLEQARKDSYDPYMGLDGFDVFHS